MDPNPRPQGRHRRPQQIDLLNRLTGGPPRGPFDIFDVMVGPVAVTGPIVADDNGNPPTGPEAFGLLGDAIAAAIGGRPAGTGGVGGAAGTAQRGVSDETAARDERLATEEDNRQLIKDADRLRKWKDRLQKDNKILREESKRLKEKVETLEKKLKREEKEKKELKENYEKVWQEKVALAEKLSGPAKLPLEILLTIGGFVAGANDYGTLLSLTLVSKRIKQEMKPVFYETLFILDPKDLAKDPGSGGRQYLDAYKFTKFLYTRHDATLFGFRGIFPNLHLIIYLEPATGIRAENGAVREEDRTKCPVRISIDRPIRTKLLASLFQCPVNWMKTGTPVYHPILGVASITVWENGALSGERPRDDAFIFCNTARDCTIKLGESLLSDEQLEETIRELNGLVPVVRKSASPSRRGTPELLPFLNVVIKGEATTSAWVTGLPDLLSRQPHLAVQVDISAEMSREKFQEIVLSASSAYEKVWDEIKTSVKTLGNGGPTSFFSMEYPFAGPGDEGDDDGWVDEEEVHRHVTLAGRLKSVRGSGSFITKIVEIDELTGDEEETFSQPFASGSRGA